MSLTEIYARYHEQVKFIPIYIREAHPVDGWWFGGNPFIKWVMKKLAPKVAMNIHDPQTIEQRRHVAGTCETSLSYGVRTYVDEMDDAVNMAYAAWPTRLYLIGMDGLVVYAGGLGPYDFHPQKLEKALVSYLRAR